MHVRSWASGAPPHGSWLARHTSGLLPVEVDDADGLLAAALVRLEDGAGLVKLYMDGPDRDTSLFTAGEVRRTVEAVHARSRSRSPAAATPGPQPTVRSRSVPR
jgi:hypothetical protein